MEKNEVDDNIIINVTNIDNTNNSLKGLTIENTVFNKLNDEDKNTENKKDEEEKGEADKI